MGCNNCASCVEGDATVGSGGAAAGGTKANAAPGTERPQRSWGCAQKIWIKIRQICKYTNLGIWEFGDVRIWGFEDMGMSWEEYSKKQNL